MTSDRSPTTAEPDYRALIRVEELRRILARDDLRVVDCRFDLMDPGAGRRSYVDEHIPGAAFLDLDEDLSAPVGPDTGRHPMPLASALANALGGAGIDESMQVVLYDAGDGALAARAWWLLRWAGHERAAILDGGLARWNDLEMPLVAGEEVIVARDFVIRPRPELVVDTGEVVESVASCAGLALVDARDEARFRGESEPIDTVAGHIPGALNLPFSRTLRADGTWRSPKELRKLWSEVLGEDAGGELTVMCGSGVTACHLVLSAMLAGYREPRVYVGSWSEWIRDPARPVARGAAGAAESA